MTAILSLDINTSLNNKQQQSREASFESISSSPPISASNSHSNSHSNSNTISDIDHSDEHNESCCNKQHNQSRQSPKLSNNWVRSDGCGSIVPTEIQHPIPLISPKQNCAPQRNDLNCMIEANTKQTNGSIGLQSSINTINRNKFGSTDRIFNTYNTVTRWKGDLMQAVRINNSATCSNINVNDNDDDCYNKYKNYDYNYDSNALYHVVDTSNMYSKGSVNVNMSDAAIVHYYWNCGEWTKCIKYGEIDPTTVYWDENSWLSMRPNLVVVEPKSIANTLVLSQLPTKLS